MAFLEVKNVKIAGISTCVPKNVKKNADLTFLNEEESKRLIASTGIEERRIVGDSGICTSDLCLNAAESLIKELGWNKLDIDSLILATQTPDYTLPATSCILQNKLNLKEECFTLDIASGCSAWTNGLSVIASLLSTGQMKKGILLIGDTLSTHCSPFDKISYLFGDAVCAIALEYDEYEEGFKFYTSTNGAGYEDIIIPDGGLRNPATEKSLEIKLNDAGIAQNGLHMRMNGMDVFSFGISKAPESIDQLLTHYNIDKNTVDFFVFHQANKQLNEQIAKKINVSIFKIPSSLKRFGNTVGASIPLTMFTELKDKLQKEKIRFVTCGFGTGLSWGSVMFETNTITCTDLIEI